MSAIALYNFNADPKDGNELTVKKNEILEIVEDHGSWWKVKNNNGKSGLVPVDFLAAPVTNDIKVVSRGKTIETHVGKSDDELSVEKNCQVAILDDSDDYWRFIGYAGKTGYIPKHTIQLLKTAPKEPTDKVKYNLIEMTPNKAQCDKESKVLFIFEKALPTEGKFIVVFKGDHCEKVVDAEQVNDFALKAETPKYFPPERTKLTINHIKPGQTPKAVAKGVEFVFESRLNLVHEILTTEADPLRFMCSSFQIEHGDVQNVDHILSGILEKRTPEGLDVLKSKKSAVIQREAHTKVTPTLLHFAAFYNLKKLAKSLLKCPGAKEALLVKNCQGMVPSSVAENNNHHELEVLLDGTEAESPESDDGYYMSMEDCYERYTKMDGASSGGYVKVNSGPHEDEEGAIYEDMETGHTPEEHYDSPRAEADDRLEACDDVEGTQGSTDRERERQERQMDEYKVFGRMTEKEVQLALIMKRVKERYITQEQALDMVKVLGLDPQAKEKQKPKVVKRASAPLMSELNRKVKSLPRTLSTSSGSSQSSVGSTGSAGSSGYTSEESRRTKPPPLDRREVKPPATRPPVSSKKTISPPPIRNRKQQSLPPVPVPRHKYQ